MRQGVRSVPDDKHMKACAEECRKCAKALESAKPRAAAGKKIYTCPMHPEIEQDEPRACPKCDMDLDPKYLDVEEEDDSELRSMTLRFWVGVALSVPVFLLAMLPMVGVPIDVWVGRSVDI